MTNKGKVITYKLFWILLLCAASFLLSATTSSAKLKNTELAEYGLMLYRQVFHVTSEADFGPGSLRDILETMASNDADGEARFSVETVIYFDVPGGVIKPETPFPRIISNTNFIGPVSFDMSMSKISPISQLSEASLRDPFFNPGDLFYIERVSCVFYNINFLNARRIRPIYYQGGSGHFIGCNFSQNVTKNKGGAVFQVAANRGLAGCGWGALTFTNCSFIENTAESGGGAIYSEGNLTLLDCVFENNVAGKYGISPPDGLYPYRTEGGAVYGIYINAIGCTFKNNQVVYLREKSEISSNDVTIRTSNYFILTEDLSSSLSIPAGVPIYYDRGIGIMYTKETITARVMLNIKNCTLIERK